MKQIRVLYYMHISTRRLVSDSNYYTLRNLLKYINRYYSDHYYFYITYPTSSENDIVMKELKQEFKNINPVPIKYHTTNAFFRNSIDWESMNKEAREYDIILSQTPEINFELLSYAISKGTYCPLISYSNWLPSLVSRPINANYDNGQRERLAMEAKYFYNYILAYKNYNNSLHGTKLLKESFEKIDHGPWKQEILNSITPLYLTTDHEEIDKYKPANLKKFDIPTIVFNHRHNVYTGFTDFFRAIERIIKLRPNLKFKIFMTSVGENDKTYKFDIPNEYFLNKKTLPYPEYVETLWKCHIQISPHTGDNQWSMSHFDGMFANLVPLYRRGHFFDEMFVGLDNLDKYNFKDDDELIEKLIFMIENIDKFVIQNDIIFKHFRNNWVYDKLVHSWAKAIDDVYSVVMTYPSSKKLKLLSQEDFPMSWQALKNKINISDQRPLNNYRKTIKEIFNLKEDMENKEIVLYNNDDNIRKTRGFF